MSMPGSLIEEENNQVSDFYDQSVRKKKKDAKNIEKMVLIAVGVAIIVALFAFLVHESQNQVPPYNPPATPVPDASLKNNTINPPTQPTNPPVPTPSIQVDYNKQITPSSPSNNGVIGGQIGGAIYVSPTGNGGANTLVDSAPQILKDAASNLYRQNTDGSWSKADWNAAKIDPTGHYAVDLNGNGAISLNEQRLYSQINDIKTNVLPNFNNGVFTLNDSSGSIQAKFPDGMTTIVPPSTFETIPASQIASYNIIIGKGDNASSYSATNDPLIISAFDKDRLNYQSSAAFQQSGYNQYWPDLRNFINHNGMPATSVDGKTSYVTDLPTMLQNYKDTNTAINDVFQQGRLYTANNIMLDSSQKAAADTYLRTLVTQEKLEMTQNALSSQFKSGGPMYNEITALRNATYTGSDPAAQTLVQNYQNSLQSVLPILQNPSLHTAQELAAAESKIQQSYQGIATYQLGHPGSVEALKNVHSYTSFSGVFNAMKDNSTQLNNINSSLQNAASGFPIQTKNQIDLVVNKLNSPGTFSYLNNGNVTVNSFMTDDAVKVLIGRAELSMKNNNNIQSTDLLPVKNFTNAIQNSNTGYFKPINTIYPPKVYSPQTGAAGMNLNSTGQGQGVW